MLLGRPVSGARTNLFAVDHLSGRSLSRVLADSQPLRSAAPRLGRHAAAVGRLCSPACASNWTQHRQSCSSLLSRQSSQHIWPTQPQQLCSAAGQRRHRRGSAAPCTVAAAAGGAAGWADEQPLPAWRRLPLLRNAELLRRSAWTVALATLVRVGFFIPLPGIARAAATVPSGAACQ